MTRPADEFFSAAMTLPASKPGQLAAKLFDTLDGEADADYEEAWDDEIQTRTADLDAGRAKTYPLDIAMKMIRGEIVDEAD